MVLPSLIFSREYKMPSSTTLLPADLATMFKASRMGTPEDTMVPRVRENRATATLRSNWPKMGNLSIILSHR